MNENLVGFIIVYYVIACFLMFILLAGIDRYEGFVIRYGMYRGVTLEVIVRVLIAAFWLPYAMFFWIRGLVKGL